MKNWAAYEQRAHRTFNTLIVAAIVRNVLRIASISAIPLQSDCYRVGDVDLTPRLFERAGFPMAVSVAIDLGLPRRSVKADTTGQNITFHWKEIERK